MKKYIFALSAIMATQAFATVTNDCDKLAAHPYNNDNPTGVEGVQFAKMNATAAINACSKAVKENTNARYQYQLGRAYDRAGQYTNAIEWYQKAIAKNYANAQYNMALMYALGKGVTRSDAKALEWNQKAAEQGFAPAETTLGWMYHDGHGVKQSYEEAIKWYKKAAEQGYPRAEYNLGSMYYNGQGVEQSYTEAAKWYQKAANQGSALAQMSLADMYSDGQGVTKSTSKAVELYKKANAQSDADTTEGQRQIRELLKAS